VKSRTGPRNKGLSWKIQDGWSPYLRCPAVVCCQVGLHNRDVVSVSTSRSRDAFSQRLGLVSVSSLSVSSLGVSFTSDIFLIYPMGTGRWFNVVSWVKYGRDVDAVIRNVVSTSIIRRRNITEYSTSSRRCDLERIRDQSIHTGYSMLSRKISVRPENH